MLIRNATLISNGRVRWQISPIGYFRSLFPYMKLTHRHYNLRHGIAKRYQRSHDP